MFVQSPLVSHTPFVLLPFLLLGGSLGSDGGLGGGRSSFSLWGLASIPLVSILRDPIDGGEGGGLVRGQLTLGVLVSVRAARTAGDGQDGAVFRFMMIKLVLDVATIAVGTQMSTAATDHVEGAPLHLARHYAYDETGAKVGGNTPNRVHETVAKAMVVAILAETVKGSVNGHVCDLVTIGDQFG